jgi:tRNA-splicing ligase RtcB
MIHSGSRNLGFKVANHYNELAIKLNEQWHTNVPKEWELAFLPIDSDEGQDYRNEMQYCVDFALANRKLMMDNIIKILANDPVCKGSVITDPMINIAHNYAAMENHFGRNVMVHRKGATLARVGTIGIIPGSQGSKSYIVEGLGNVNSFMSCSHGAGRKMSRTKATKELNLENEIKILDDQGIVHGIRTSSDLDEATGAYKDIQVVMNNQLDLVKIVTELTPIAVIKG